MIDAIKYKKGDVVKGDGGIQFGLDQDIRAKI